MAYFKTCAFLFCAVSTSPNNTVYAGLQPELHLSCFSNVTDFSLVATILIHKCITKANLFVLCKHLYNFLLYMHDCKCDYICLHPESLNLHKQILPCKYSSPFIFPG